MGSRPQIVGCDEALRDRVAVELPVSFADGIDGASGERERLGGAAGRLIMRELMHAEVASLAGAIGPTAGWHGRWAATLEQCCFTTGPPDPLSGERGQAYLLACCHLRGRLRAPRAPGVAEAGLELQPVGKRVVNSEQ
jgi:hypothetical protein